MEKNTTPEASPVESLAPVPATRVRFAGEVLQQIRQHARSSLQAEICGVLIGRLESGVTHVTARIPGDGADEGGAHVTFTQNAWEHIYRIKDAQFPDDAIVGWYHSHPGFGIFLSDYDLFIHENFFTAPHQIAWVVDPHSEEDGCFGWAGKKVVALQEVTIQQPRRELNPEQVEKEAKSRHQGETRDAVELPEEGGELEEDDAAHWYQGVLRYVVIASLMILSCIGGFLVHELAFPPRLALTPEQQQILQNEQRMLQEQQRVLQDLQARGVIRLLPPQPGAPPGQSSFAIEPPAASVPAPAPNTAAAGSALASPTPPPPAAAPSAPPAPVAPPAPPTPPPASTPAPATPAPATPSPPTTGAAFPPVPPSFPGSLFSVELRLCCDGQPVMDGGSGYPHSHIPAPSSSDHRCFAQSGWALDRHLA